MFGKYGGERNYLTRGELDAIYRLSANPVDNVRMTVASLKNEENCADFFMTVYGAYRRYWRPWWQHPRWHIHHWQLQVHPWQTLRRWLFTRCCKCGKRFPWGASVYTDQWDAPRLEWFQSENGVYHSNCSNPYDSGQSAAKAERGVTLAQLV